MICFSAIILQYLTIFANNVCAMKDNDGVGEKFLDGGDDGREERSEPLTPDR